MMWFSEAYSVALITCIHDTSSTTVDDERGRHPRFVHMTLSRG
jgi:hypothetical protein